MMIRHILSVTVAAFVTVAVGAQGPDALEPGQRRELYKKNRDVIERLVLQTVRSSKTPNDHLKRADAYYPVLFLFSQEIQKANSKRDTARVTELTDRLTTLLKDGLAPTLDRAKQQVEGGSGVDLFPEVKRNLLAQISALQDQLAAESSASASLVAAKDKVDAITIPEKK
jgi:hypothetical protein